MCLLVCILQCQYTTPRLFSLVIYAFIASLTKFIFIFSVVVFLIYFALCIYCFSSTIWGSQNFRCSDDVLVNWSWTRSVGPLTLWERFGNHNTYVHYRGRATFPYHPSETMLSFGFRSVLKPAESKLKSLILVFLFP